MINETMLLTCPACAWEFEGASDETISYPCDESLDACPQEIRFCQQCGLGVAYPLLSDEQLEKLYQKGQYWQDSETKILTAREYPGRCAVAQAQWKFISIYLNNQGNKKEISVLDVGAGQGFLGMAAAKDKQLRLERYCAVEADPYLRGSLIKTWEKSFSYVRFEASESVSTLEGTFDVVILSHIIEHLPDPKMFLKEVVGRLNPDGVLFVDVPYQDYRFKSNVFPHLLFFNEENLRKLFKAVGLRAEVVERFGKDGAKAFINSKGTSPKEKLIVRIVYKLRKWLPASFSVWFFDRHLGASFRNPQGIWIRALAKRSEGRKSL
ncbi:MAG: class I SAM-dependent methyltransferase [Candidatus Omnitrophica bacterium]|nr:class I SAM-dependent methyltransferase [Candidatus Omnitrophota bacterium]